MFMKTFLIILKNCLKKDYPDVKVEFYVSRRSKFVHMGLDIPINKIARSDELVKDIEKIWLEKSQDNKFKYVNPYLINSTKWKFDYIIFEKNFD